MIVDRKRTLLSGFVILSSAFLAALGPQPESAALASPQTHDHGAARETEVEQCAEHDVLENECGICHPDFAASLTPGQGLKIRFASGESVSRAGVSTAVPSRGSISNGFECYAEIVFDQNRMAHVASPVDGVLEDVSVDLGDGVQAGDPLARLSSAAIAQAQGEHLKAVAEYRLRDQAFERERALFADRISSEKDVQEAAAARDAANAVLQESLKRLRVLGFHDRQIELLESAEGTATGSLDVRTPLGGEIIERDAVRGARVESGKILFVVADRSAMWGILNIPESELPRVRVGQRVEFTSEAAGDKSGFPRITGRIAWISAQVDARTRMAKARAEIRDGADGTRSGTFARAWVETGSAADAVIVPESAVQRVENRPFIFIKLADDLYEARAVALGASRDGRVEVTEGLDPREQVAVAHSFIVKSELLKSRLGAGCADN